MLRVRHLLDKQSVEAYAESLHAVDAQCVIRAEESVSEQWMRAVDVAENVLGLQLAHLQRCAMRPLSVFVLSAVFHTSHALAQFSGAAAFLRKSPRTRVTALMLRDAWRCEGQFLVPPEWPEVLRGWLAKCAAGSAFCSEVTSSEAEGSVDLGFREMNLTDEVIEQAVESAQAFTLPAPDAGGKAKLSVVKLKVENASDTEALLALVARHQHPRVFAVVTVYDVLRDMRFRKIPVSSSAHLNRFDFIMAQIVDVARKRTAQIIGQFVRYAWRDFLDQAPTCSIELRTCKRTRRSDESLACATAKRVKLVGTNECSTRKRKNPCE
jgi:hypothetical protein